MQLVWDDYQNQIVHVTISLIIFGAHKNIFFIVIVIISFRKNTRPCRCPQLCWVVNLEPLFCSPFLDPHLTTHLSNISVRSRWATDLGPLSTLSPIFKQPWWDFWKLVDWANKKAATKGIQNRDLFDPVRYISAGHHCFINNIMRWNPQP